MFEPAGPELVTLVVCQTRVVDGDAKLLPLAVVARCNNHVPIPGGKNLVRNHVGMGIAIPGWNIAGHHVIDDLVAAEGYRAVHQCHVDVLSGAAE